MSRGVMKMLMLALVGVVVSGCAAPSPSFDPNEGLASCEASECVDEVAVVKREMERVPEVVRIEEVRYSPGHMLESPGVRSQVLVARGPDLEEACLGLANRLARVVWDSEVAPVGDVSMLCTQRGERYSESESVSWTGEEQGLAYREKWGPRGP